MNILEQRADIIRRIISLHNHQNRELTKRFPQMLDLWNVEEFEAKPDRYFLVESINAVISDDYDNKTFYPKLEVRKHLRSQEKRTMDKACSAFYDGYLGTYSFGYEDIEDVEAAKIKITEALKPKE